MNHEVWYLFVVQLTDTPVDFVNLVKWASPQSHLSWKGATQIAHRMEIQMLFRLGVVPCGV